MSEQFSADRTQIPQNPQLDEDEVRIQIDNKEPEDNKLQHYKNVASYWLAFFLLITSVGLSPGAVFVDNDLNIRISYFFGGILAGALSFLVSKYKEGNKCSVLILGLVYACFFLSAAFLIGQAGYENKIRSMVNQ